MSFQIFKIKYSVNSSHIPAEGFSLAYQTFSPAASNSCLHMISILKMKSSGIKVLSDVVEEVGKSELAKNKSYLICFNKYIRSKTMHMAVAFHHKSLHFFMYVNTFL